MWFLKNTKSWQELPQKEIDISDFVLFWVLSARFFSGFYRILRDSPGVLRHLLPKDIFGTAARTLAEEIRHAGGVRRAVVPWERGGFMIGIMGILGAQPPNTTTPPKKYSPKNQHGT